MLDDEKVIVDLLRLVIEDLGHLVLGARDPGEIPASTRPDLVISDLMPAKGYGREPAKKWIDQLRARFGKAPILIVTAHGAALVEPDALGADAILGKPFEVESLLAEVNALLAPAGSTRR